MVGSTLETMQLLSNSVLHLLTAQSLVLIQVQHGTNELLYLISCKSTTRRKILRKPSTAQFSQRCNTFHLSSEFLEQLESNYTKGENVKLFIDSSVCLWAIELSANRFCPGILTCALVAQCRNKAKVSDARRHMKTLLLLTRSTCRHVYRSVRRMTSGGQR